MGLSRVEKPSFTFNKGLNSDASPMMFPEDFSLDELNFELLLDGTRRRRRGLEQEGPAIGTGSATSAFRTFKWPSVGGNPDLNFVVWQVGTLLYFSDDTETPADDLRSFTFDLASIATPEGFDGTEWVDLAPGRGHLIVTAGTLEPTYIVYDEVTDTISGTRIEIRERDFKGVVDGVDDTSTTTILSDELLYNLLNAGWKYADITTFFNEKGYYPAKNMIYYLGYRRETIAGFSPDDGTKQFSSDKLIEELFQDAPAPKGHFIVNPFDRSVTTPTGASSEKAYVTLSGLTSPIDPNSLNVPTGSDIFAQTLVTFTFDRPHGYSTGQTFSLFSESPGKYGSNTGDGSREWAIHPGWTPYSQDIPIEVVPDASSITFYLKIGNDATGWNHNYAAYWPGGLHTFTGSTVTVTDAEATDFRPSVCAFFAGRAWYAGVPDPDFTSIIYFSQIVEADIQYSKCYQVADPTSENISDLVATDGGVIRIPESGRVLKMVPYSSSLLVYASNGIWQIGPGSAGYFAANSYSIRKITDAQCTSGASVIDANGVPMVWALAGIYAIIQDENSGYLSAQPANAGKIETYYANILEASKRAVQGAWDPRNKRAIWVYPTGLSEASGSLDEVLVYDSKFDAFTPWRFSHPDSVVGSVFTTRDTTEEGPPAIRFLCLDADLDIIVAALSNDDDYTDLDGDEEDAYMVAGYDTAQSPHRYKYAPIITVFLKRTETGFTDLGGGDLVPINDSSLTMQARWDWADATVSGKWGTAYETYRHRRMYTPTSVADTFADGQPVVVTRNKVRGRGRSLHLKFTAGTARDAHLLGWATNYQVLTDN